LAGNPETLKKSPAGDGLVSRIFREHHPKQRDARRDFGIDPINALAVRHASPL
jgi:hypothetical protein